MANLNFQHQDLAASRWAELPFHLQMGNIGSEVSRARRAREEFCDYFFGDNTWHTNPEQLQRYYDQFVLMRNRAPTET